MVSHTENEILSQPDVWQSTIDRFDPTEVVSVWNSIQPHDVLVTGCGSTFYLSLTVASLLRNVVGISARGIPASELVLQLAPTLPTTDKTVLIAISRSGTTSETLAAVDRFKEFGGAGVVTVTNHPDSPLAQASDVVLGVPEGQEQSVAQTRSFSSMLLIAQMAIAGIAEIDIAPARALPGLAADLLEAAHNPMTDLASDVDLERFYFLGSDPLFGVASEGMLKLKEMSLTDSEAFHTLEFRHGPMSMVDPRAAVVGLFSEHGGALEAPVVHEAADLGARTITIGKNADLVIAGDLPGWARPVLHLPPLQILALERARSKGLDPDRPRNLVAVIELDGLGT
ncbi:MAG: SIS domain-containing protein [Acidimicrobiia bacterium]|nr:MAG: SIS domain-containing protein [Acidimicrobiia bacterium]